MKRNVRSLHLCLEFQSQQDAGLPQLRWIRSSTFQPGIQDAAFSKDSTNRCSVWMPTPVCVLAKSLACMWKTSTLRVDSFTCDGPFSTALRFPPKANGADLSTLTH